MKQRNSRKRKRDDSDEDLPFPECLEITINSQFRPYNEVLEKYRAQGSLPQGMGKELVISLNDKASHPRVARGFSFYIESNENLRSVKIKSVSIPGYIYKAINSIAHKLETLILDGVEIKTGKISFTGGDCVLQHLTISNNNKPIIGVGLIAILESLQGSTTLTELNFQNNSTMIEGREVCEALLQMPALVTVNMRGNKIRGVFDLAKLLSQSKNLLNIDLHTNAITSVLADRGEKSLYEVLLCNKRPVRINMGYNNLDDKTVKEWQDIAMLFKIIKSSVVAADKYNIPILDLTRVFSRNGEFLSKDKHDIVQIADILLSDNVPPVTGNFDNISYQWIFSDPSTRLSHGH